MEEFAFDEKNDNGDLKHIRFYELTSGLKRCRNFYWYFKNLVSRNQLKITKII